MKDEDIYKAAKKFIAEGSVREDYDQLFWKIYPRKCEGMQCFAVREILTVDLYEMEIGFEAMVPLRGDLIRKLDIQCRHAVQKTRKERAEIAREDLYRRLMGEKE